MMKTCLTIVRIATFSAILATTTVNAETTRAYLSIDQAIAGLTACHAMATEQGWNMAIVVVDRGEDVRASMRMDEALPAAYTGATLKATTALAWFSSTAKVAEIVKKSPAFNQFPGLLPIAGGEPIFATDSSIIGGVGVAGNSPDNDQKCAAAAVKAMSGE